MKNKNLFIIFLLIIIFGCKYNNYSKDEIINSILSSNKNNYKLLLDKYKITNFNQIKLSDPNYLFLIGKLLYDRYGYNEITEILLAKAVKIENLFQDDALSLYIKMLINNKSFNELKKFIKNNERYIKSINQDLLIDYANSNKIQKLNDIPEKPEYFPVLYLLLKDNYKEILSDQDNRNKIDDFFIKTKLYQSKDQDVNNMLKDIINWYPRDYFLGCIYYFNQRSANNFSNNIEYYIRNFNDTDNEKLEIIRDLALNMGLRKSFFQIISKYYNNNKLLTYYYAIDAVYLENYRKGINLLYGISGDFQEKSDMNYNIRYFLLYNSRNYSQDWISKVADFYNDYPNNYKSKLLFNDLIRYAIVNNKGKELAPIFSKVQDNATIDPLQKSLLLYKLYLMDNDNRVKWKEILTKDHPLSYGALRLNQGVNFTFNRSNPVRIPTEKEMSLTGFYKYKKIKYLLELDFFDEAKKISLLNVPEKDKSAIFNVYYQYYIGKENYYRALQTADDVLTCLYGNDFYKADNIELVKKYYPMHYKEYILQYSKEFNVDPALAFAVMREESYFNKNIVSYQRAIGLMQIIPPTGRFIAGKLGIKNYDLYNPKDNIRMGIFYLNFLSKFFDKKELILSGYNAGHGKTKVWCRMYGSYPEEIMYELIPIYETRYYIVKVMKSYYMYKYLLENENNDNNRPVEDILKDKLLKLKDTLLSIKHL